MNIFEFAILVSSCSLGRALADLPEKSTAKDPLAEANPKRPTDTRNVADKHAAPLAEKEGARTHGLGGHRPLFNQPPSYPQYPFTMPVNNQGIWLQDQAVQSVLTAPSHVAAQVPVPVPVAHPAPIYHQHISQVPTVSQTTYTKPYISYAEQYVQKPVYTVAQQVIHKPYVTEKIEVIRTPVVTEVLGVVHKPILTEYQQIIRQPLYKQHIILKPSYNAHQQVIQTAPHYLSPERYELVAQPQHTGLVQLPTRYIQPYTTQVVQVPVVSHQTETLSTVHIPTAPTVPIVPIASIPSPSYGGYGTASSFFSPYECKAGECGAKKNTDVQDILMSTSAYPSTPQLYSKLEQPSLSYMFKPMMSKEPETQISESEEKSDIPQEQMDKINLIVKEFFQNPDIAKALTQVRSAPTSGNDEISDHDLENETKFNSNQKSENSVAKPL